MEAATRYRPARTRRAARSRRVRRWLRRTSPAPALAIASKAPSVVAAGPELDLASNDPLVGYLLSAASAVDITACSSNRPR